jgi:hypothetical protein
MVKEKEYSIADIFNPILSRSVGAKQEWAEEMQFFPFWLEMYIAIE